ncbi:MAG: F-type H+-transporting ATPase subunit gamma [Parasphingorhabdus sp.]|jgi:F-type H+-transporting ATPase subunit gamma|tara:strand:- start:5438 stop:6298 length:861 start_codon:yes stop_codon:yes gene_type:complete
MAIGKEVKTKIASIGSTRKITSAMEMVAASKMRRAQERMALGKPYAIRIRDVVGHIANAHSEYHHQYLAQRDVKRVAYIVISTDRGLCGGLNINLFKAALRSMKSWSDQDIEVDICVVGNKAAGFFSAVGGNVVAAVKDVGDEPNAADLIGGVKVMLDAFDEGRVDRLFIVNNTFVNTMTQTPTVAQLLPLAPVGDQTLSHHWDYVYEPDAKELLDGLLIRYIESQVYQGVVENKACEQAARMLAMRNATENAGEMIDELQLLYNKARQAAITQELSEIVSGAAAV